MQQYSKEHSLRRQQQPQQQQQQQQQQQRIEPLSHLQAPPPPPSHQPHAAAEDDARGHFPIVGTLTPDTATRRRGSRAGEQGAGQSSAGRARWGSNLGGGDEEWDASVNPADKQPPAPRNKNTWHVLTYSQAAPLKSPGRRGPGAGAGEVHSDAGTRSDADGGATLSVVVTLEMDFADVGQEGSAERMKFAQRLSDDLAFAAGVCVCARVCVCVCVCVCVRVFIFMCIPANDRRNNGRKIAPASRRRQS